MSIWLWLGIGIIIAFVVLVAIVWLIPEDEVNESTFLRTIKNCCKRFMPDRDDREKYF